MKRGARVGATVGYSAVTDGLNASFIVVTRLLIVPSMTTVPTFA